MSKCMHKGMTVFGFVATAFVSYELGHYAVERSIKSDVKMGKDKTTATQEAYIRFRDAIKGAIS